MTKNVLVVIFSILLNFCLIGNSGATLIQIGDQGNFELANNWGIGHLDYSFKALTHTLDLGEGQTSERINFFSVTFNSLFGGSGEAEVQIDFLLPVQGTLENSGRYWGFSIWRYFQAGGIYWGDPQVVEYGNGGSLLLDLDDLIGIKCGSTLMISGTITNMNGSSPIREPATMIMIGTGIIGLAGLSRKKIFRSGKR